MTLTYFSDLYKCFYYVLFSLVLSLHCLLCTFLYSSLLHTDLHTVVYIYIYFDFRTLPCCELSFSQSLLCITSLLSGEWMESVPPSENLARHRVLTQWITDRHRHPTSLLGIWKAGLQPACVCVCSESNPVVVCNPGTLIAPAAQLRQPSNDADWWC